MVLVGFRGNFSWSRGFTCTGKAVPDVLDCPLMKGNCGGKTCTLQCAKYVWTGTANLCLDGIRGIQRGFMRVLASDAGLRCFVLCALMISAQAARGQNPPNSHVVIPNPTPRELDLEKVYGDDTRGKKKREALVLKSQLRAREVWLESNQILLLAQQLQQEILSDKKSVPMTSNAAKVAKIEKLAQSVQEKMKTQ